MKKFITWMLVLIVLAGAVFAAGWIQFRVPAGQYGVYVTKTRGWHPEVLVPGRFAWSWEALIPSNFRLFRFTLEPRTETVTLSGTLPSSEVYAAFAVGSPDFSYEASYGIVASVRPEALPKAAESRKIESQEALDAWLSEGIRTAGESLRGLLLARASDPDWIAAVLRGDPGTSEDLAARIGAAVPDLEIRSVSVRSIRVPDLDLYEAVKAKYLGFLASADSALSRTLEREAQARAQTELRLESLERYGQLITKYPKLIDFLAVENRTDAALLEALGKRVE